MLPLPLPLPLGDLWAACEAILPCPYVFGGRDQERQGGLDCAGYVLEALHRVGIDLTLGQPYDTGKWLVNVERIVDQCEEVSNARPGDLIIFHSTYNREDGRAEAYSHVGIIKEPQPVALMFDCHQPEAELTHYGTTYWQGHYKLVVRVPGLVSPPPAAASPWTFTEIAAACDCPLPAVALHWGRIVDALTAVGQGSQNSLAVAAATVAIETASTFLPVREAYWLSEAWRATNLSYYPYYGRGFVQLTHSYNYEAAGEALDLDLVGEPDLALEPDPAAASLAWYWQQHDIQALADAEDWQECRQAVVGYVPNPPGLDRLVQIVEKLL